MAIDKALLDQLLAGREPQDLFAKGGLIGIHPGSPTFLFR